MQTDIRPATSADLPFLREMQCEAVCWRTGRKGKSIDEILAKPELAKLLDGFGEREGDFGLIAENQSEAGVQPAAAAWFRLWTDDDHSYGYVDEETPELAIAVCPELRGLGLGRALMLSLLAAAYEAGFAQLSLSVEKDNPALALYESLGFEKVGEVGNAYTMVHASQARVHHAAME